MPHLDPAGNSTRISDSDDVLHAAAGDDVAPSTDVVTHHWVNDAEWGDIEEIVVCGEAA